MSLNEDILRTENHIDYTSKLYHMINDKILQNLLEIEEKHKNELSTILNDLIIERDRRNRDIDDQIEKVKEESAESDESSKDFLIEGLEREKSRYDNKIQQLKDEITERENAIKLWNESKFTK